MVSSRGRGCASLRRTGEYIRGLCGVLKGGNSATKELLAERKRDREKEEA
jgi:hypothetical protein